MYFFPINRVIRWTRQTLKKKKKKYLRFLTLVNRNTESIQNSYKIVEKYKARYTFYIYILNLT